MKLKQYVLDVINKDIQSTEIKIRRYESILQAIPEAINPRATKMEAELKKTRQRLESAKKHRERLKMILAKQILKY